MTGPHQATLYVKDLVPEMAVCATLDPGADESEYPDDFPEDTPEKPENDEKEDGKDHSTPPAT